MLHFVTSYMKQNKSRKQTLESVQYGLEIILKCLLCRGHVTDIFADFETVILWEPIYHNHVKIDILQLSTCLCSGIKKDGNLFTIFLAPLTVLDWHKFKLPYFQCALL